MKARRSIPFALCIALSQASCGAGAGGENAAGTTRSDLSTPTVQLIAAEVVSELGAMQTFDSKLVARMQVSNSGSAQTVFVNYQVHAVDGTVVQAWTSAPATWIAGSNWELQTPIVPGQCPQYCNELIFDFAVGYTVAGQTYWDNNGSWNYQLASDVEPVPGGPGAPAQLHSAHVMLSDTSWTQADNIWRGRIIVDNVAYRKVVNVVYSTNGWRSTQTASASYWQATENSLEYWTFAVPMGTTSSGVDFAIEYEVGGQTYWDNRLSANYHQAAPSLVFHETFDSENALVHPAIGPAGAVTGTPTFVPGTLGNAYYVDTATSGALTYPGSVIPVGRGTIELQAKLYTPPTDIPWHDSPFFFLAPVGAYDQYTIGMNGNDGYSGGGLVGWAGNGNMATGCYTSTYTYADVLGGDAGVSAWHRYAVAWDRNGVPGTTNTMQVYVDGQPVGTSSVCGENHRPSTFPAATSLLIGYIQDNFGGSAVAIDEFKIWNYAKAD